MVYASVSQLQCHNYSTAASMVTRNPLGAVCSTLSYHDIDCNDSTKYNRTQPWTYYTNSTLSTSDLKLKLAYYSQQVTENYPMDVAKHYTQTDQYNIGLY